MASARIPAFALAMLLMCLFSLIGVNARPASFISATVVPQVRHLTRLLPDITLSIILIPPVKQVRSNLKKDGARCKCRPRHLDGAFITACPLSDASQMKPVLHLQHR